MSPGRRVIERGVASFVLAALASLPLFSADFEDPAAYSVKRTWSSSSLNIPGPLGGLLFDAVGTKLYVVGASESGSSAVYEVPVTRDPESKEVTDLGPPAAVSLVFGGTLSGLDAGLEYGPNGTLFYTYWPAHYLGLRPGGMAGAETLYSMSTVGAPVSIAGLTFSPHFGDPNTAFGMMQASVWSAAGERRLFDIPLIPKGDGIFEPQQPVEFATLPRQGTGAIQYIPTGPLAGNMMYVNWNYGEIMILSIDSKTGLPIDDATGEPLRGTQDPRARRFAYNLGVGPWGLEFDPLTNDFFVSTWGGDPSNTILQIGGFPPPRFVRGDVNADQKINIADAVSVLFHLFALERQPPCADSGDTNDDGEIALADSIYLLAYLFNNGPAVPAPFGACGTDPTSEDGLGCGLFPPCSE
jgi:hypothetical protein